MNATAARFWTAIDQLVRDSTIKIDRPQGSHHPRFPDLIYPHAYGHLEQTRAMDGGGIDIWLGSLPEKTPTAILATVDLFKRDSEIKILLGCTAAEIQTILAFHNTGSQSAALLQRVRGTKCKPNPRRDR
ncbi:MAG: hypothetical protein FWD61_05250 [Phycisphaerales bacterium]|nr:hypothetical protein [Phycisphaerales bacterium]